MSNYNPTHQDRESLLRENESLRLRTAELERQLDLKIKLHQVTLDKFAKLQEDFMRCDEFRLLHYDRAEKAERELAAVRKERDDAVAPLPETFYPELPLAKRVEKMAQINTGLALGNQQLQRERDALAAALAVARKGITLAQSVRNRTTGLAIVERSYKGNYLEGTVEYLEGLASQADDILRRLQDPKAILAAHDAAKDAEIAALSAGLSLAHQEMRKRGIPECLVERTCGLDSFEQALGEHDRALVKPLVEALVRIRDHRDRHYIGSPDEPEYAQGRCDRHKVASDIANAALAPYKQEAGR